MAASDWRYLGGKTRRYQNVATGETISRRQYDQRFGRLAESGLTLEKFARKNLMRDPALAMARPARGRKSAIPKKVKESKPKKPKLSDARKKELLRQRAKLKRKLKSEKGGLFKSKFDTRTNFYFDFDGTPEGARDALKTLWRAGKILDYWRIIVRREGENNNSSTTYMLNPYSPNGGDYFPKLNPHADEDADALFYSYWRDEVEEGIFLRYGSSGEVISTSIHMMNMP